MIKQFTHPQLGRESPAPSGYYTPVEEHLLPYKGEKVLYILGNVCIDSSCCGTGNWSYLQVPGYLYRQDSEGSKADGPKISQIKIIQDESDRWNIRQLLAEKYPSARIEMW